MLELVAVADGVQISDGGEHAGARSIVQGGSDAELPTTIPCYCRKLGMPRPLRCVPEDALVEITTRILQSRRLLRPSPEPSQVRKDAHTSKDRP